MSFESDCLQLIKLINDEEDWPSMTSEWNEFIHLLPSFTVFEFIHVRPDLLAKDARLQNSIFSHVNSLIPARFVSKANFFT